MKRSETDRNEQERSGTVKNGQERWTPEAFILYKINGMKRFQNHVHVQISKMKEILYKWSKKRPYGQ
jgi:hypothetical protein